MRKLTPVWLRKTVLAAMALAFLFGLAVGLRGLDEGEVRLSLTSLDSMDAVEQQAWQLARDVAGTGKDVQERFVAELMELYHQVKDNDFAIVTSSGGWGKKPLAADYQGQTWLSGIEAKLGDMGYSYCVVENLRTGGGLREQLFELREYLTGYPTKARELSAKIDFLTRNVAGLKIVVTGLSNGAAFAGETATYLVDNPGVYFIEVGRPFWYPAPGPQTDKSLVIEGSGAGNDALTGRDILSLVRANLPKLFLISRAPSFTPVDWLISRAVLVFGSYDFNLGLQAPGHEYLWEDPGVGPVIEAFLVKNFGIR